MQYGVISNYDKKSKMCNLCVISDDGNYNIVGFKTCSEEEVVLGVKSLGLKLLNFSIDKDNNIKQDSGSFSRFSEMGTYIIIAEIKGGNGKTMGYRVIENKTNNIVNKRTQELVAMEEKAGRPIIQNGIVRNGTVCCYPLHQFPEMIVSGTVKKIKRKPIAEPKKERKQRDTSPAERIPQREAKQVQEMQSLSDEFTKEQKKEITTCRNKGVDSTFIENKKLSPKQMRVLWVSKSKGAFAEEYANPDMPLDVMKFYADVLYSQDEVNKCRPILDQPKLKLSEVSELYECLGQGFDVKDLIGKSSTDIAIERMAQEYNKWNKPEEIPQQVFEDSIISNAIRYAKKVRGY